MTDCSWQQSRVRGWLGTYFWDCRIVQVAIGWLDGATVEYAVLPNTPNQSIIVLWLHCDRPPAAWFAASIMGSNLRHGLLLLPMGSNHIAARLALVQSLVSAIISRHPFPPPVHDVIIAACPACSSPAPSSGAVMTRQQRRPAGSCRCCCRRPVPSDLQIMHKIIQIRASRSSREM